MAGRVSSRNAAQAQDWAARRAEAISKAKELRAERSKGIVDEESTFEPKFVAKRMPSSGPSLTEIADTDVLDKYAQRMPAQSAAQRAGQNYGDSGGGRDRAPSGGYRRMNSYGDEPDMEPHRRAVARDLDYDDDADSLGREVRRVDLNSRGSERARPREDPRYDSAPQQRYPRHTDPQPVAHRTGSGRAPPPASAQSEADDAFYSMLRGDDYDPRPAGVRKPAGSAKRPEWNNELSPGHDEPRESYAHAMRADLKRGAVGSDPFGDMRSNERRMVDAKPPSDGYSAAHASRRQVSSGGPVRPRWNDDPVPDSVGDSFDRYDEAPPARQQRIPSGRRAGQVKTSPPSASSVADMDPSYVSQVSSQAAPKLTLLKAKIQRSRSRVDSYDEEVSPRQPEPPARSGYSAVSRGPPPKHAVPEPEYDEEAERYQPAVRQPVRNAAAVRASSARAQPQPQPAPPQQRLPSASAAPSPAPAKTVRRPAPAATGKGECTRQSGCTCSACSAAEDLLTVPVPRAAAMAAPEPDEPLQQCPHCERKFNEASFEKHVTICEKVFLQKRKAFDSKAARVEGTEAEKFVAKKGKKAAPEKPAKKANWEAKSNQLRDAMKAARMYKQAVANGEDVRNIPMAPSAPQDDLVPCPNCGRRFNETAAERHIPKCADIKAKPSRLVRGHGGSGMGAPSKPVSAASMFGGASSVAKKPAAPPNRRR